MARIKPRRGRSRSIHHRTHPSLTLKLVPNKVLRYQGPAAREYLGFTHRLRG